MSTVRIFNPRSPSPSASGIYRPSFVVGHQPSPSVRERLVDYGIAKRPHMKGAGRRVLLNEGAERIGSFSPMNTMSNAATMARPTKAKTKSSGKKSKTGAKKAKPAKVAKKTKPAKKPAAKTKKAKPAKRAKVAKKAKLTKTAAVTVASKHKSSPKRAKVAKRTASAKPVAKKSSRPKSRKARSRVQPKKVLKPVASTAVVPLKKVAKKAKAKSAKSVAAKAANRPIAKKARKTKARSAKPSKAKSSAKPSKAKSSPKPSKTSAKKPSKAKSSSKKSSAKISAACANKGTVIPPKVANEIIARSKSGKKLKGKAVAEANKRIAKFLKSTGVDTAATKSAAKKATKTRGRRSSTKAGGTAVVAVKKSSKKPAKKASKAKARKNQAEASNIGVQVMPNPRKGQKHTAAAKRKIAAGVKKAKRRAASKAKRKTSSKGGKRRAAASKKTKGKRTGTAVVSVKKPSGKKRTKAASAKAKKTTPRRSDSVAKKKAKKAKGRSSKKSKGRRKNQGVAVTSNPKRAKKKGKKKGKARRKNQGVAVTSNPKKRAKKKASRKGKGKRRNTIWQVSGISKKDKNAQAKVRKWISDLLQLKTRKQQEVAAAMAKKLAHDEFDADVQSVLSKIAGASWSNFQLGAAPTATATSRDNLAALLGMEPGDIKALRAVAKRGKRSSSKKKSSSKRKNQGTVALTSNPKKKSKKKAKKSAKKSAKKAKAKGKKKSAKKGRKASSKKAKSHKAKKARGKKKSSKKRSSRKSTALVAARKEIASLKAAAKSHGKKRSRKGAKKAANGRRRNPGIQAPAVLQDNLVGPYMSVGLGLPAAILAGAASYALPQIPGISGLVAKVPGGKIIASAVGGALGVFGATFAANRFLGPDKGKVVGTGAAIGALLGLVARGLNSATAPTNPLRMLVGSDPSNLSDAVGLSDADAKSAAPVPAQRGQEQGRGRRGRVDRGSTVNGQWPNDVMVTDMDSGTASTNAFDDTYGDGGIPIGGGYSGGGEHGMADDLGDFAAPGTMSDAIGDDDMGDFAAPGMGDFAAPGMGEPWNGKPERGTWNAGGMGQSNEPNDVRVTDFIKGSGVDAGAALSDDDMGDFAAPGMGDFAAPGMGDDDMGDDDMGDFAAPGMGDFAAPGL